MSTQAKPGGGNWFLVVSRGGRRVKTYPLSAGTSTAGRDPTNPVPLPDSSVSRQHAEFMVSAEGVSVRDLGSRNGIHVNGVPRKRAALQPGDKVAICDFLLELTAAAPADTSVPAREPALAAALRVDPTIEQRVRLPDARPDRDLAALYHACFWVADGVEETTLAASCLGLLLEALRSTEVHLYSETFELAAWVTESGKRPAFKPAAFLARRFQEAGEAVVIHGAEIARHQRGAGDFNYLVCPLRPAGSAEPASFVVALRAAELQDYAAEDRVLLQAIAQLWVRGQAKTRQLSQLRQENVQLREKTGAVTTLGRSAVMQKLEAQARKAAATSATILIRGETGSGKEVLAQFIHENSPRHGGPLVKLNCAAIPDSLIESELFGYVKGAFSGAVRDYSGRFAQAHRGTLFLDEIGEMPLLAQAKVLRAIEHHEVTPLGSETATRVDLRLIAATNKDLRALVRERQFREDLYYRLDVQTLRVPPLREHREDLDDLARLLLRRFCAENGLAEMDLEPSALAALRAGDWPGNIRELGNLVQRCALAAEGAVITRAGVEEQLEGGRG